MALESAYTNKSLGVPVQFQNGVTTLAKAAIG